MKRRSFMKNVVGTSAGVLAAPFIIPSSALGLNNKVAPSDRIVMGLIGSGSMGNSDLDNFLSKKGVQVIACCDVDAGRRVTTKKKIDEKYGNSDCRTYEDYREMLEKDTFDTMVLALPDHWHSLVAVAVANKKIDIYGEKPLARTITECRAIVDAAQKNNIVWQTGSWQRSVGNFRHASELVINGRIGKVDYVEVGLPNGRPTIGTPPVQDVPEGLNWDMWLGSAPKVPFRGVCHWDWRWIMDYSGGQLTDWAGHHIDVAHWGMGFDRSAPVTVEGKGVYPLEGIFDVPVEFDFLCEYKTGERIRVSNARQAQKGQGITWFGDKGWIHVSRRRLIASDENILKEVIGDNEIKLYRSDDHWQNFIDCVRSREETAAPVEIAHRSISVGLLGEIAMLTEQKLVWDMEKEQITNSEYANRLLTRPFRQPWIHP